MALSLAERMLAAADTLEEVSRVYDYMTPSMAEWSPARLRTEAQHVAQDHPGHVCDSDGREETHTLCSVCGTCDNGI